MHSARRCVWSFPVETTRLPIKWLIRVCASVFQLWHWERHSALSETLGVLVSVLQRVSHTECITTFGIEWMTFMSASVRAYFHWECVEWVRAPWVCIVARHQGAGVCVEFLFDHKYHGPCMPSPYLCYFFVYVYFFTVKRPRYFPFWVRHLTF